MENETLRLMPKVRTIFVAAVLLVTVVSLLLHTDGASQAQTSSAADPDAPALTAEAGEDAIALSWTAVSGATRYELWVWWESDTDWVQLDSGELTTTNFRHDEVAEGTTYYYLVRAVSESGELGAWSERVAVTIEGPQTVLAAPILSAAAVEGGVELSWTPVAGAAGYELWAWTRWEDWQRLDDGSLSATAFSHTGLPSGVTYYYGIRAIDERGGASEWAQRVSAKVPGFLDVPEIPEERAALVALYEATDGANWRRQDNWLTDLSITNWYGVQTDQQGHVTGLFLENNGLRGNLPDLSALKSLASLDLGINRLSGPLPDLGALTRLTHLSLRNNAFTGHVPELSSLVDLRGLDLENNRLTGPIPDVSSLTGLTTLYLSDNELTGPIPDLSELTNLQWLGLSSNRLTGPVPDLCSLNQLTSVYLGSNQLTGPIPELCELNQLKTLHLSNNQITGEIPDLSGLLSLEVLYLNHNGLTGSIPDLSTHSNLWRLVLGSNQLTGTVPELNGLTNLTQVFLENNRLTGPIPDLENVPKLTDLDLSGNSLEGPIPELGALTRATNLKMGSNLLTGAVPAPGGLTFLKELDLSDNGLTGGVPELGALFRLEILDLSENRLSGQVPDLSGLKRLVGVSMGGNQLSGIIPDLGALESLRWLFLESNRLTGQLPDLSLASNLRVLNLSDNRLTGPVVDLDALKKLTRLSLSDNLLTGPLPDFGGLSNLIFLELAGNKFCQVPGSGRSGSSVFVNAHLESLSLADCPAADPAIGQAVPRNLQATVREGRATLKWDAAVNAVSYDLRAWDSIDRSWSLVGDELTVTYFSQNVETDGRNYYYQVRARDADGVRSAWSKRLFAAVVQQQFRPPPQSFGLELFFQKYLDVDGVVVVAPSEVTDGNMSQARDIITGVLATRADLLDTLAVNGARIEFFGYWGEAGGEEDGWVAEVTQYDPNCGHFLQEFAHLIRRALEEQPDGEEFRLRLDSVYESALEEGLWRGGPASAGSEGYWAEAVKSWFWEAMPYYVGEGDLKLKEYDNEAAKLIEEILGDASVPPVCKP